MRAIIIEDEPLSVAELRTTLAEVAPQIEVVATASSVAEAAAVIAGVGHDLIFGILQHKADRARLFAARDLLQRHTAEYNIPAAFTVRRDHAPAGPNWR